MQKLLAVFVFGMAVSHGASVHSSDVFSVKKYIESTRLNVFGDEFTLTATKIDTKGDREAKIRVRFLKKGQLRKSEQEVLQTDRPRTSAPGHTAVVIESKSDVTFLSSAADSKVFFIEQITSEKKGIDEAFREVLPAYGPYTFRGESIEHFVQNKDFKVTNQSDQEVSGQIQRRVEWESSAVDPKAGKIALTGFYQFFPGHGWTIASAGMDVALDGKPPLYSVVLQIDYSLNADGKNLPSHILQTTSNYESKKTASKVEYTNIAYDFASVDPQEFELASYGLGGADQNTISFRAIAYVSIIVVLVAAIFVVQRRRLSQNN